MGISKIILGPKSKLAEQDVGPYPPEFRAEVERENAALRAQVATACCGKGGCAK